jgi:hypothetical protein
VFLSVGLCVAGLVLGFGMILITAAECVIDKQTDETQAQILQEAQQYDIEH